MKTIKVEPVTRIESHGKLTLELNKDGSPSTAFFSTPVLRGFEAFLRGAPIERVPWLASRICGVCPVSHSITAAKTIEKALSISVPETAEILREILVLSQLIDSHALSFVILSLPDLVPKDNIHGITGIKEHYPKFFEKGMRLHTIGRKLTHQMGGRNVHPINVKIGGVSVNPLQNINFDITAFLKEAMSITQEFLANVKEWFSHKEELVKTVGSISTNYMGLSNDNKVSFVKEPISVLSLDNELMSFPSDEYSKHLDEMILPQSYMKLPYLRQKGPQNGILRVNCLARANINDHYGTSLADQELQELRNKWGKPLEHSLLSHWVRLIEILYACERLEVLLDNNNLKSSKIAVTAEVSKGVHEGVAAIEAPRGTLFHHYKINNNLLTEANFFVATQNNGLAVNKALLETLKIDNMNNLSEKEIIHHCEMVIRAYDPCISCSTHTIHLDR